MTTVLHARPRGFVSTPAIERIITRALRYLQSGFPVHLRGPAGTGKTTLALHLADLLSRPIMLLFGDDEFKSTDLIGNQSGYTRKKVVDNFIHSVVKMEDELRHNWVDSRLTLACREGFTLVYDEFNRSRPEVNNVLLSALEEKLLVLPPNSNRNEYIRVNPHFRAIFTSNPEEYCGVHDTQDALLDRLITINVPEPDELTQQEIIAQKIGIDRQSAVTIVQLVKQFRQKAKLENSSGLRSCLMISKICHEHGIETGTENAEFRDLCQDILLSRSGLPFRQATQVLWETFNGLVGADIAPYESTDHLINEPDRPDVELQEPAAVAVETVGPAPIVIPEPLAALESALESLDDRGFVADDDELLFAEDDAEYHEELTQDVSTEEVLLDSTAPDLSDEAEEAEAAYALVESEGAMADAADLDDSEVDLEENLTDAIATDQFEDGQATGTAALVLAVSETIDPDLDNFSEVPFEREVYSYLQTADDARPSEIEVALGINRFQAINALRSLVDKGLILAQSSADKPSTYRLNSIPATVH